MSTYECIIAVASAITATGVLLAWWQIRVTKKQAITDFEDRLTAEYRNIVKPLPVSALLGEEIDQSAYGDHLGDFYQYIDLTNQQVFLRREGRVSKGTWEEWAEGIRWTFSLPAFLHAWHEISHRLPSDCFTGLRRMIDEGDQTDPQDWAR